jgi:hypothetical protein
MEQLVDLGHLHHNGLVDGGVSVGTGLDKDHTRKLLHDLIKDFSIPVQIVTDFMVNRKAIPGHGLHVPRNSDHRHGERLDLGRA